jgi:hypothetical protein
MRANAQHAGITLPQRLTIDPDEAPAYDNGRRDIDAREAAGARSAKAKLAPA